MTTYADKRTITIIVEDIVYAIYINLSQHPLLYLIVFVLSKTNISVTAGQDKAAVSIRTDLNPGQRRTVSLFGRYDRPKSRNLQRIPN
jgi:hypothetical protein